ncbi:MAG: hypothetical protein R2750_05705 [Bacteroidales bacterium]
METREILLVSIVIMYIVVAYLFSRLGKFREIGTQRLFLISLFLTPVIGLAFFLSSSHIKMKPYTEQRFKCDECGYVFSEDHEFCPFCEKEGKKMELHPVNMFMT